MFTQQDFDPQKSISCVTFVFFFNNLLLNGCSLEGQPGYDFLFETRRCLYVKNYCFLETILVSVQDVGGDRHIYLLKQIFEIFSKILIWFCKTPIYAQVSSCVGRFGVFSSARIKVISCK